MWNEYHTTTPYYADQLRRTFAKHKVNFVVKDTRTVVAQEDSHPSGMQNREKQYRASIIQNVSPPTEIGITRCGQQYEIQTQEQKRGFSNHPNKCKACRRLRDNEAEALKYADAKAGAVYKPYMEQGDARVKLKEPTREGEAQPAPSQIKVDDKVVRDVDALKSHLEGLAEKAMALAVELEAAIDALDTLAGFDDRLKILYGARDAAIQRMMELARQPNRATD